MPSLTNNTERVAPPGTPRRGRPPAVEPDEVDFDVTVVDGEAGRRLAAIQAQAILDVLTWFSEHASAEAAEPHPAE